MNYKNNSDVNNQMSQQSSFIANPLSNDSQTEQVSRIEQFEKAQSDQVDEKDSQQNPFESDGNINSDNESEVLNHLIDNDNPDDSQQNESMNPMFDKDPISLENVIHEKLSQIGQQYHQCQTVIDCDKSIDVQVQNPLNSCDDFQHSKNPIIESKSDQLKQLETQLQECQKINKELENQITYIQQHSTGQIQSKQKEVKELQKQNSKLEIENKVLKELLSKQQKEINDLQKLIKDSDSELLTQQRSKTGAESQKGYFFQEPKFQQSLNDQTLQSLTPQSKLLKKIPTLSIEAACPFSVRNKQENNQQDNKLFKHSTTATIEIQSDRKRISNQPKSQATLSELIQKAKIANSFQKAKIGQIIKVQGFGQINSTTPKRTENGQQFCHQKSNGNQ